MNIALFSKWWAEDEFQPRTNVLACTPSEVELVKLWRGNQIESGRETIRNAGPCLNSVGTGGSAGPEPACVYRRQILALQQFSLRVANARY